LDTVQSSVAGETIIVGEHGDLQVPAQPVIAVVGAGDVPDIWAGMQPVLAAAVAQAYGDQRLLVWYVLEDVTLQEESTAQAYPVILNLSLHTHVYALLCSGIMMFKYLAWHEAAEVLQKAMLQQMNIQHIPEDAALSGTVVKVSHVDFYAAMLAVMSPDEEANQYDVLADKFHEVFDASADKTTEFAHIAMEKAREQLTLAGHFTEEQGQKLKTWLSHDFSRVTQAMKVGAKEKLNPSRLGAGALASMSKLLHLTGVALSQVADKADGALACKSGEITSAGSLRCHACHYEVHFKKTGRIPPCPKCHKTEFSKGY